MYIPLPMNPLDRAAVDSNNPLLWFIFRFSQIVQSIGIVRSKPVGLTKAAANEQKITVFHCSLRRPIKQ